MDTVRGIALAPVRLGGRPMGSMALIGSPPSEPMVRAIVNLRIAITIEKARALEDASHAEAARQSEVLKSALLDSLAHDIKTPLTSIKAAVTSLLGDAPNASRELLTIINEEADRLNRLAAEVVEMARIEAGKLHLEKEPVEVADLIDGARSELALALKGRPVTLQVSEELPPAEADQREFASWAGGEAIPGERTQILPGGFTDRYLGSAEGRQNRNRSRRPRARHRRE